MMTHNSPDYSPIFLLLACILVLLGIRIWSTHYVLDVSDPITGIRSRRGSDPDPVFGGTNPSLVNLNPDPKLYSIGIRSR